MKQTVVLMAAALAFSAAASAAETVPPRDEWFRDLDLEEVTARSELILVARVEEIRDLPLPVGGKGEIALLQVTFQPVRTLKGVFAREALTLTSYELGAFESGVPLERLTAGELRLLFLGRAQSGYHNLHAVPRLDRALPPLRGEADPMTSSVTTLLEVVAAPERSRRVALLTDALMKIEGHAAVPLLEALPRRAVIAAQRDASLPAVARHLAGASPAVRAAALESLVGIDDPGLDAALVAAANDAGLEGTSLLERVETRLGERKVPLAGGSNR